MKRFHNQFSAILIISLSCFSSNVFADGSDDEFGENDEQVAPVRRNVWAADMTSTEEEDRRKYGLNMKENASIEEILERHEGEMEACHYEAALQCAQHFYIPEMADEEMLRMQRAFGKLDTLDALERVSRFGENVLRLSPEQLEEAFRGPELSDWQVIKKVMEMGQTAGEAARSPAQPHVLNCCMRVQIFEAIVALSEEAGGDQINSIFASLSLDEAPIEIKVPALSAFCRMQEADWESIAETVYAYKITYGVEGAEISVLLNLYSAYPIVFLREKFTEQLRKVYEAYPLSENYNERILAIRTFTDLIGYEPRQKFLQLIDKMKRIGLALPEGIYQIEDKWRLVDALLERLNEDGDKDANEAIIMQVLQSYNI